MQNYYGYELLGHVIAYYEKDGYNYTIYYLDGKSLSVTNYSHNFELNLRKTMLRQLKDSNCEYDRLIKYLHCDNIATFSIYFLASFFFIDFGRNYQIALLLAESLITFFAISTLRETKAKIEELKKVKLFLEMQDKLSDSIIDYPSTNIEQLNVNTLDTFSYKEIKELASQIKTS